MTYEELCTAIIRAKRNGDNRLADDLETEAYMRRAAYLDRTDYTATHKTADISRRSFK